MTSFAYPVPNGKYLVKLHFTETCNAITGPCERVFTFVIEGREFKNFDVWSEAGGAQRAYVETVTTEVNDGVLVMNYFRSEFCLFGALPPRGMNLTRIQDPATVSHYLKLSNLSELVID